MLGKFIEANKEELIRDVTSLGGYAILVVVLILTMGFTSNLFLAVCGLLLIGVVSNIIKFLYPKERPKKQKYTNNIEMLNARSFPSVHVGRSFFVLFSLSTFYDNIFIKILLYLLIAATAFTRVAMKKHYWVDVFGGLIIGLLVYLLIGSYYVF